MLASFTLGMIASFAAATWNRLPSPDRALLDDLTPLTDGRWFGIDRNEVAWLSSDRGGHWDSIPASSMPGKPWIFAEGAVVCSSPDSGLYLRYDPATGTWPRMRFDRPIRSEAFFTQSVDDGHGTLRMIVLQGDSLLAFHSKDTARTWTSFANHSIASGPNSIRQWSDGLAGDRFWIGDTSRQTFRATSDGIHWIEIAAPTGLDNCSLLDTLPGGGWFGVRRDSLRNLVYVASRDSGRTWSLHDISTPGSVPSATRRLSDSWELTASLASDTLRYHLRPAATAPWSDLPAFPGRRAGRFFLAAGLLHVVSDSGLFSLDPSRFGASSGLRQSAHRTAGLNLRLRGRSATVTGIKPGTSWQLLEASGRSLASGIHRHGTDLELPSIGSRARFLRLTGPTTADLILPVP